MKFEVWIANEIKKRWDNRYLGELSDLEIEVLQEGAILTDDEKNFVTPIYLLIANIAAALSTGELLGSASKSNLKSVKSRMDTSAAHMFSHILNCSGAFNYIATSEAKDERGELVEDPLKKLTQLNTGGFGIAVDVVDGTTLAATGLNGSYSISAAALGLSTFPDLQAYAVGAPKEVLEKFNFYNDPEEEIFSLIENLSWYYKKPPCDIKVVTHSFDTGLQHTTLIEKLKSKGVQVIVPEPVIVESPYTLRMALRTPDAPDCMIGVFGLPEIVINTLLLAIMGEDYELQFRIASNTMLEKREQVNLKNAFSFRPIEKAKLDSLNLSSDVVYTKKSITSELHNACFSATALTDDPVLGLSGFQKKGILVKLETLFSGYSGFTIKLKTCHKCQNSIDYSACFSQPIDDLSIVIPIQAPVIIQYLKRFILELKNSLAGSSLDFTPISDLHVTLYEFGVHYGGFSSKAGIETATEEATSLLEKLEKEILCNLIGPKLTRNAVLFKVKVPDTLIDSLKCMQSSLNSEFFNVKRVPEELHITIARYNEYLSQEKLDDLASIIKQISWIEEGGLSFVSKPTLIHITSTPYTVNSEWSR